MEGGYAREIGIRRTSAMTDGGRRLLRAPRVHKTTRNPVQVLPRSFPGCAPPATRRPLPMQICKSPDEPGTIITSEQSEQRAEPRPLAAAMSFDAFVNALWPVTRTGHSVGN